MPKWCLISITLIPTKNMLFWGYFSLRVFGGPEKDREFVFSGAGQPGLP